MILGAGAGAGTAFAEPKEVTSDPAAFAYVADADKVKMQQQMPLLEAAEPIQQTIDADLAANPDSGFAGVALGQASVIVNWKGTVPSRVKSAIDAARADEGVAVDVSAAKYSRAELEAAATLVRTSLKLLPDRSAFEIQIPVDGSGLTVTTEGSPLAAKLKLPALGLPITVRAGQVARPASGRLDDTAPFKGGARINNNDNDRGCSSSFAVHDGQREYLLTAGHCGRVNGSFNNGNDTHLIGTATRENVGHDIMLVQTDGDGRMYDGGVGTNEFSKPVWGSAHTFAGEWVCTSGSVTGAVCNVQVENNFTHQYCITADMYGNRECYSDLVTARQVHGTWAARKGDSGGPVFGLTSDWSKVIAKGVISGFSPAATGDNGGARIAFQDFVTAQRDFGIWTITG